MKNPFFSIIIPTYNNQQYIARCIQSCIDQTFQNIEIILINDQSTDKSQQIILEYINRDQRIKLINNHINLGPLHSRKRGIEQAKGTYCLFVDSDDFIDSTLCETIFQYIQNKNPDILHYQMQSFPKTLKRLSHKPHLGFLNGEKIIDFFDHSRNLQSLCDKAFKTSILQKAYQEINFNAPILTMEDGLIVMLASFVATSYFGINNKLYFYRINPHSTTQNKDYKIMQKKLFHYQILLNFLDQLKNNSPKEYEHIITNYQNKVKSTSLLETRYYHSHILQGVLTSLKQKSLFPSCATYLQACLYSLKYFYRWQTLARICIYLITFGKIKL